MSGGSLDYSYIRLEDAASAIASRCRGPLHCAFADHLLKVSKALHDVEWVLSGDYGEGDDTDAIRAVITPEMEMASALDTLKEAMADAAALLERANLNTSR